MLRKIFYFLLLLVLIPSLVEAGTKGRIRGKVVDLQTGEPLIGANVIVLGTSTGAATDINGEFLLLNLEAGTYAVRASYLGYQTITINNVRINADLTTYIDFELPSEDIQVGTVEIVAQKPLVQKDNTNAVRITNSDDIEALPVRGVNSIIGLTAGVVLQNGNVYIRGGRSDEVGYYLEGVSITNPVAGGRAVSISQDAVEEIQVQSGGYTAEFGGANAGIIRQALKSGGTQLKASLEYITDNVGFSSKDKAFDGEKRLGAYWWGYNEMSAVLSGPLFDNRFKFFTNFNYVYTKDGAGQKPGVNVGIIGDPVSLDTINFVYPAGPQRNVAANSYTYVATLNMDFQPVMFRLSGTYTAGNSQQGGGGVQGFLQTRLGKNENSNGAFSVKMTHVLSPSMYYELNAGYYTQKSETFDQALKDNYWAYGDSVANAEAGWTIPRTQRDYETGRIGRYTTPRSLNVMGFTFTQDGAVPVNYSQFSRSSMSFGGALTFLIGKVHSFKIGGDYQQYTLRTWSVGSQSTFAGKVNQFQIANPNASADQLQNMKRQLLLTGGVNNYGFDVFGNETDEEGFSAPHKPVFASAFIQDRIEYEDLIINAGLRYDYIDIDNLTFANPARPDDGIDPTTGELDMKGWSKVPTFSSVSPRIGFSFPITDKTVFHAQFGKFIQQPQLSTAYRGYYRIGFEVKGGFFIPDAAGSNIRPTRTTQYELGFTQQLTDFMAFDLTGYYRDIKDQVVYTNVGVDRNSAFQNYNALTNGDFATTKGVELSLNMRRYERVSLNASLSFQDAKGTGSNPYSSTGIVGSPLDGVTIFNPKYISPLTFNNSLRGNINVDYRFGVDDGPAILNEFGVSALVTFNSGHPFTRGIGSLQAETDARSRQPIEALNASITPSEFQVDLRIDKTIRLFDKLSLNIYVFVINLFDTKNVRNVFLRSGSPEDDAVISDPELSAQLLSLYGDRYIDLYKAINIDYQNGYGGDGSLWGPPRQIRLGFRLEY
ncbi:hypothetical protein APF79_04920 [bacterium BRH_c32]|nr:MAG: hypothetical protein APF79_04920 [bacterium BRH_c32]